VVREIRNNEFNALLELYLHLHEDSVPEISEYLHNTWESILKDNNHHIIVNEINSKIISTCVCVIIPNLTRNLRPYAFIENVVTHADYRKKGYATQCLDYAAEIERNANCYKMMLLTGSKEAGTLDFYRSSGYNSSDKTAFVQWLE